MAATSSSPIKHIVLLIQENRSFDHMLGRMNSINPEIDGVTGEEHNHLEASDPNSERLQFGDDSIFTEPDPGHTYEDIYEQVFGEAWSKESEEKKLEPKMNGFAQNAKKKKDGKNMVKAVMNGFTPERLPVYTELLKEFAVCDRWFASLPTETHPNRLFFHSATSIGLVANEYLKLAKGFSQKTIYRSLEEAGLDFGIYFQFFPNELFYKELRDLKYLRKKFHFFDTFKKHCKQGKLPNYCVIEPRYYPKISVFPPSIVPANDDHPKHDVYEGQKLVKEIYEALRASPQWNETLFIVTYDEHGGFYDHVPPPSKGVPRPDDEPSRFNFDRLGVRVPAFLISPWIEPGTVLHEPSGPFPTSQFEHSSVPATVKKIFNLKDFLTKRDAWAGTLDQILTRTTPRTDCPEKLPNPVQMRSGLSFIPRMSDLEDMEVSEFQDELLTLAEAVVKSVRDQAAVLPLPPGAVPSIPFVIDPIKRRSLKYAAAMIQTATNIIFGGLDTVAQIPDLF